MSKCGKGDSQREALPRFSQPRQYREMIQKNSCQEKNKVTEEFSDCRKEAVGWYTAQIQGAKCRAQLNFRGSMKAKGEGLVSKHGKMGKISCFQGVK